MAPQLLKPQDMYDWKVLPISPEQHAQEHAQLVMQDAAIAKGRAQNRIFGTVLIVGGIGALALGTMNLLTGAAPGFHSLLPVLGGGWSLLAGIDRRRGT